MLDLIWLVLDFVFSIGLDALFDALSDLPKERKSRAQRENMELAGAALVGLVVGGVSGWLAPERVLPPGPFDGLSLILLPAFLGIAMDLWGRLRRRGGGDVSALSTWYGGATLGLCLALGRFAMLNRASL